MFTRRRFLYISTISAITYPFVSPLASVRGGSVDNADKFPLTVGVLRKAFQSEITASRRYSKYSNRALVDEYPNIAYTFAAFAVSEKIHANNFMEILKELGITVSDEKPDIPVSDTKSNLEDVAKRELEKIGNTYPNFFKILSGESHDNSIIHCMYALKSHRQHEKEIQKIAKYTGMFFGAVSDKIEKLNLDFHICGICGSTLDAPPKMPCEICNHPPSYYKQIPRPKYL